MAPAQATVEFAADLRFFLRPDRRDRPVPVRCDGVSSLGHVIESLGVPLTEAGTLSVNGAVAAPAYRPAGGDRVSVAARPRPQPIPAPRFLLDVHLGTVARRLRLIGVDTAYRNDAPDPELIDQANAERRVLLTQDRGLLRQHRLWLGAFVRGGRPAGQFADILGRFRPPLAPWTRCPACNGVLTPAAKPEVEPELEPGTRRSYDSFARCPDCHRVYWHGAHTGHLDQIVATARRLVTG